MKKLCVNKYIYLNGSHRLIHHSTTKVWDKRRCMSDTCKPHWAHYGWHFEWQSFIFELLRTCISGWALFNTINYTLLGSYVSVQWLRDMHRCVRCVQVCMTHRSWRRWPSSCLSSFHLSLEQRTHMMVDLNLQEDHLFFVLFFVLWDWVVTTSLFF